VKALCIALVLFSAVPASGQEDASDEDYVSSELEDRLDSMDEHLTNASGYVCSGPRGERAKYLKLAADYEKLRERASDVLGGYVAVTIRTRACENYDAFRFADAMRRANHWQRRVLAELRRMERE
jgi:hypothetical protein